MLHMYDSLAAMGANRIYMVTGLARRNPTVHVFSTISHRQILARASSNALQSNDGSVTDGGISKTVIGIFVEELLSEESLDNVVFIVPVQYLRHWLCRFCIRGLWAFLPIILTRNRELAVHAWSIPMSCG